MISYPLIIKPSIEGILRENAYTFNWEGEWDKYLSSNPNAIQYVLCNPNKRWSRWIGLSSNPHPEAIRLLNENKKYSQLHVDCS